MCFYLKRIVSMSSLQQLTKKWIDYYFHLISRHLRIEEIASYLFVHCYCRRRLVSHNRSTMTLLALLSISTATFLKTEYRSELRCPWNIYDTTRILKLRFSSNEVSLSDVFIFIKIKSITLGLLTKLISYCLKEWISWIDWIKRTLPTSRIVCLSPPPWGRCDHWRDVKADVRR